MAIPPEELKNLIAKYNDKLKSQIPTTSARNEKVQSTQVSSQEYTAFKKQYMPKHLSVYEKACHISEKLLKFRPPAKKEQELSEAISIAHLSVTPTGVTSLAYLVPILILFVGLLLGGVLPVFLNGEISLFFLLFFTVLALSLLFPLQQFPFFVAENWRMKASNQMVLCIFYVVTYMRHTSNLELAIEFASEHLTPPLSLDLRKVLWDVETERYSSIKESLEAYLATWKKYNMEFIESFHLIESSLFEGSEVRRVGALDKALSVMLDETYEKMLHYAQNLKSPLTMLHMLGIILPILGLVILPLVVSFSESVKWYHLAILYDVALPIGVYYLAKTILSKRPTGYGDTDVTDENPELKKYKNVLFTFGKSEIKISPAVFSTSVFLFLLLIAFLPLIFHAFIPNGDIAIMNSGANCPPETVILSNVIISDGPLCKIMDVTDKELKKEIKYDFAGYRESISKLTPGETVGPYGLGAAILSLFIPLSLGLSVGLYHKLRSKNVIKLREEAKNLEKEFASALFQLGNRLGDGLPAEIAFGKVAQVMEGTTSGNFFSLVESNIRRLGYGVEQAIFDSRVGALNQFPSTLIESSMKVLIESAKKGPRIAAEAVLNVSRYIKEIHKVDERLKDLLADIISDVKSQINFLTPAISGIVIGITSMVTTIIGKLGSGLKEVSSQAATAGQQTSLIELFGDGIPTFYFQLIVGIYVVEIIYILTIMSNGIENGADSLNEQYLLGQNLIRTTILYTLIAGAVMIMFNIIATNVISSQGF